MNQSSSNCLGLSPTTRLALSAASVFLWASLTPLPAEPGNDNRAPDVPAELQVPADNKVQFHAYAVGVQIYVCQNTSSTETPQYTWVFKAPEAWLFDADGNVVGTHYAGPTWESLSGSLVVGARKAGVPVDSSAIPWLLLSAKSTDGPGIFARTTWIQRVNTTGGLAPTSGCDADHLNQEARVPYTAEYYFYRSTQ